MDTHRCGTDDLVSSIDDFILSQLLVCFRLHTASKMKEIKGGHRAHNTPHAGGGENEGIVHHTVVEWRDSTVEEVHEEHGHRQLHHQYDLE